MLYGEPPVIVFQERFICEVVLEQAGVAVRAIEPAGATVTVTVLVGEVPPFVQDILKVLSAVVVLVIIIDLEWEPGVTSVPVNVVVQSPDVIAGVPLFVTVQLAAVPVTFQVRVVGLPLVILVGLADKLTSGIVVNCLMDP